MDADLVLALDAGTSGARALIARPGTIRAAGARREWAYRTPPEVAPFGRSLDADTFWLALCGAIREALDFANASGKNIAAVAVTSQRLAVVIVDEHGAVLYAGPNADARAIAEGLAIDGAHGGAVYRSGGKLPSLLLAPAKLHWLEKHEPDAFARAAAILSLGDWVAYKLTGEMRAERSLAGDCGLLDVSTGERDEALLHDIDVPLQLMPPLCSPGEIMGKVSEAAAAATRLAAGTPVTIAGADTQCGLLGMGVEQPGEAGIVTGWSCPLHVVTERPVVDAQRRTWTNLHVVPDRWVVESSTADAGRVWRWWCETLLGQSDNTLHEAALLAHKAALREVGTVLALLGPRRMNAGRMGLHMGGLLTTTPISEELDRGGLLVAALENIGFALRANWEQAREVAGAGPSKLSLGGGMTRVPIFSYILASVLNRPLALAGEDVTASGCAVLAARLAGLPEDGLRSEARIIEPTLAWTDVYERQYNRWCVLSTKLDDVMKDLP